MSAAGGPRAAGMAAGRAPAVWRAAQRSAHSALSHTVLVCPGASLVPLSGSGRAHGARLPPMLHAPLFSAVGIATRDVTQRAGDSTKLAI